VFERLCKHTVSFFIYTVAPWAHENGSNLNLVNNFDSVVFILACLYCKVRIVRIDVWCKMAGVTFDLHYHYHYVALTWFATSAK
jgi:hypothetical protein